ncbi:MAG: 23S rRNA (guanosine(2251)-2'-O)-methyltransferase RlmB [Shewanellaceae bacterium]|nr:23S rRNA (guanosine(2251)-2'-O)-methyltransferase RlmB [Shewanellaceae bacterium]
MKKNTHVVYGIHAVSAVLRQHPERIVEVWMQKQRQDNALEALQTQLSEQGTSIQWVTRETLEKHATSSQHQGIALRMQTPKSLDESDLMTLLANKAQPLLLILDGVTDPHNLGACLRNADAAGVDAIVVPKDNAVGLTPVVYKVASGAASHIPLIEVTNLARTMGQLKQTGMWLMGAAGEASQTLYQADLKGSLAIVMGAEGRGLRRLTREHCDVLMSIPMQGSVSSLNVSVAAGVCLYEAVRQRQSTR